MGPTYEVVIYRTRYVSTQTEIKSLSRERPRSGRVDGCTFSPRSLTFHQGIRLPLYFEGSVLWVRWIYLRCAYLIMKLVGLNSDSRLHLSALSGLSRSKWLGIGRRQSHNYRHHFGFDNVRDSQPESRQSWGGCCNLGQESRNSRDLLGLG